MIRALTAIAATAAALGLSAAACAPGYYVVAEDYAEPFDVPAGGRLDLVMYEYAFSAPVGFVAAGTPEERCDRYGGHLNRRTISDVSVLVCEEVDF